VDEPQPFIKDQRRDMRVILAAMDDHGARGIDLPENLIKAAVYSATQGLASSNDRVRAAAGKLILGMMQHNLARFLEADRIARLDGGLPTARTAVDAEVALEVDLMSLACKDPKIMAAMMAAIERDEALPPGKPE
jgi:hypothetical protein